MNICFPGNTSKVILSLLFSSLAFCAPRKSLPENTSNTENNAGGPSLKNCLVWKNPTLNPNLKYLDSNPDLNEIPEGMAVMSPLNLTAKTSPQANIDCSKPLLIFVHGWSRQGLAPKIPNLAAWMEKFNVAVYYWHRKAFDPLFPNASEDRANAEQVPFLEASEKLISQMTSKGFKGEIRIVAHSMGSQVVLKPAVKLFRDSLTMPRRIELLDPYIRSGFKQIDTLTGKEAENYMEEHKAALFSLSSFNVKTVVYSTIVTKLVGKNLAEVSNYQLFDGNWLGGNIAERHNKIIEYYFESLNAIVKPLPGYEGKLFPFSAAMRTEDFPRMKLKIAQLKKNLNSWKIEDLEFKRVDRSTCDADLLQWTICF